jgi:uncharacterized protein (DUF1778 family)
MKKEKQSERVSVRLTPKAMELLEKQAEKHRRSVPDFIRWLVLEEVEER